MTMQTLVETKTVENLKIGVKELLEFLRNVNLEEESAFEKFEVRMDYLKELTKNIDKEVAGKPEELKNLQEWFRKETDPIFSESQSVKRARIWPEGYPGDYLTLELVYANGNPSKSLVGQIIDQYCVSRTLSIAVRSRLQKLANILRKQSESENGNANWLNIACGPARELLSVPAKNTRTIWCVDYDQNALTYAQDILKESRHKINFIKENAFKLSNSEQNIKKFGKLSTIYSAGLFDYIDSERLTILIKGIYNSLAPDGLLIAPFKDKQRYETFDYHWFFRWYFFLQRTEDEFHNLLARADIPKEKITLERDDSGVILFFLVKK